MKAHAPLHTQKECGYPLAYKQMKNKYQRQIALGNFVNLWIQWVVLSVQRPITFWIVNFSTFGTVVEVDLFLSGIWVVSLVPLCYFSVLFHCTSLAAMMLEPSGIGVLLFIASRRTAAWFFFLTPRVQSLIFKASEVNPREQTGVFVVVHAKIEILCMVFKPFVLSNVVDCPCQGLEIVILLVFAPLMRRWCCTVTPLICLSILGVFDECSIPWPEDALQHTDKLVLLLSSKISCFPWR